VSKFEFLIGEKRCRIDIEITGIEVEEDILEDIGVAIADIMVPEEEGGQVIAAEVTEEAVDIIGIVTLAVTERHLEDSIMPEGDFEYEEIPSFRN